MIRILLRVSVCAAVVAAVGVLALRSVQADRVEPVYRFTDARWRAGIETNLPQPPATQSRAPDDNRTDDFPSLSLEDEFQFTVTRRVREPLLYAEEYPVPADHVVKLRIVVPPQFHPNDRLALGLQYKLVTGWFHQPSETTVVEDQNGEAVVRVEMDVPAETAGGLIGIHVEGTVIPREKRIYFRTMDAQVPAAASLEFAMGIEPGAWAQGPVEFRVSACRAGECTLLFSENVDPARKDRQGWLPRRVSLAAQAGQAVSFLFETETFSEDPDVFQMARWGNPTVYARRENPGGRPNIILISVDTLSAKHLPTYGYPYDTAPFLDGVLAKDGLVFDRLVAAATTTPQSHMSMFTAVQPCVHGVVTGLEIVRADLVTLAEEMRGAGYETGAVTEDGWLGYEHGFGRGFNFYAENKSPDIMLPSGQIDVTLAKARAWVERNEDKRFFLFLHSFQVHDPYSPPAKYTQLFRDRDGVKVGPDSPRGQRELVAYDQEIRYADDQIAEFFAFLDRRGLLDNTVVIVTADHGEEFFEHGMWGHGPHFYEEVSRVPLILWGPGRIPAGERSGDLVGHIDLMPTILALAGVATPPQNSGRNILAPFPAGSSSQDIARFSESHVESGIDSNYEKVEVLPPAYLVQQGSHKLARYRAGDSFRYEAYDVDRDPAERSNLFAGGGADIDRLRKAVDGYEDSCVAEPAQRLELEPEREQKLKALGYLQ